MVTVSPKYQVVIPRVVRERLGISPGDRVQVLAYEGRVELVPVKDLKTMRGFLRGLDANIPRDNDRI